MGLGSHKANAIGLAHGTISGQSQARVSTLQPTRVDIGHIMFARKEGVHG